MRTLKRNLTLAALLAAASVSAQAADIFDLRAVFGYKNWTAPGDPESAPQQYFDFFNNGNALTGGAFVGTASVPNPLYFATGAPTELSPPGDLTTGDGTKIGLLRFTKASADSTALVVNGTPQVNSQEFLRLQGNFFNNEATQFLAESVWSFVVPDANSRYGIRLSDAGLTGGPTFNDLISLDVVRGGNGLGAIQIRRASGNTVTGERTITGVQTRSVASFLDTACATCTLSNVDLVNLRLGWWTGLDDLKHVFGRVELLDHELVGGVDTFRMVGGGLFEPGFDIFNGESSTRLQVGAQWIETVAAVPEPGTYALMLGGLAAMGMVARRRRR